MKYRNLFISQSELNAHTQMVHVLLEEGSVDGDKPDKPNKPQWPGQHLHSSFTTYIHTATSNNKAQSVQI